MDGALFGLLPETFALTTAALPNIRMEKPIDAMVNAEDFMVSHPPRIPDDLS